MRAPAILLAVAAAGTVSLPPPRVRAAACCMSATAVGIGRLLSWESFALGLRTSFSAAVGQWTTDGAWRVNGDGTTDYEWRSEAWALVAVHPRVALFGRLPWLVNAREAGNLGSATATGIGDVQAGARWEVLGIGEVMHLPALALTFAVTAPTGSDTDDANADGDALGASVTGRGAWILGVGASIEKTHEPWFVRLDLDVSLPLPSTRAGGRTQRYGPGVGALIAGGHQVRSGLVLSLYARSRWEAAVVIDGRQVDNSSRVDTGIGAALSWRFLPRWTLQGGMDSALFLDALGHNQPGRVTATAGLRYGHF